MRILYFDMETAPNLGWFYKSKKPQYMNYHQVIQHEFVTSIQWQLEGEKTVKTFSIVDDEKFYRKNPTNDIKVIQKAAEILENADILVVHNGKRFDWPEFKKKIIFHRLDPVRKPYIIDTLAEAKTAANLSNSLRNLADYYKVSEKAYNEADPAKLIYGDLDERIAHIKKQTKYGKKDIPPLREFYLLIRPYMDRHPHMGAKKRGLSCPMCGGHNYTNRGRNYLSTISSFKEWHYCRDCRKQFPGKIYKEKP